MSAPRHPLIAVAVIAVAGAGAAFLALILVIVPLLNGLAEVPGQVAHGVVGYNNLIDQQLQQLQQAQQQSGTSTADPWATSAPWSAP